MVHHARPAGQGATSVTVQSEWWRTVSGVIVRGAVHQTEGGEVDAVCMSGVERSNLMVRTFMRLFTRLTLRFGKKHGMSVFQEFIVL